MTENATGSAADFLPSRIDLPRLREAAAGCQGCPLYRHATRTVFGEGRAGAPLLLVGEQPGDQEDLQGHPFVGPAGRLLKQALAAAELPREEIYLTNAVKHFKWELRGKRRLHKKPGQREIAACHPWLAAEVQAVRPRALVCLGVTAATSVFGSPIRLKDYRGRIIESPLSPSTLVTAHPSSLLRLRDAGERALQFAHLVDDFRRVRGRLAG